MLQLVFLALCLSVCEFSLKQLKNRCICSLLVLNSEVLVALLSGFDSFYHLVLWV